MTDRKRLEEAFIDASHTPTMTSEERESQKTCQVKTINHVLSIIEDFKDQHDRNLIIDALDSSKFLSMIQMMKVVRMIYYKAMESTSNAYSMTWLSFLIMEKEEDKNRIFLESLLTCCREWFSQNDLEVTGKKKSKVCADWEGYLVFLRELYMSLQTKKTLHASGRSESDRENIKKYSQSMANLILDASLLLIHPKRSTHELFERHLEMIISIIRCVGVYLENDNSWKTSQLLTQFRTILLTDDLSCMSRKNLMEGIEYRASGWMFNQNQQVYYFPYTKK